MYILKIYVCVYIYIHQCLRLVLEEPHKTLINICQQRHSEIITKKSLAHVYLIKRLNLSIF